MWWIVAVVLLFGLIPYTHFLGRGRTGLSRWAIFAIGVAVVTVSPFFLPEQWAMVRFFWAMCAMLAWLHLAEVLWNKTPDPAMQENLLRFVLYATNAPTTHWPADRAGRRRARVVGVKRVARALAKAPGLLVLVALSTVWPELHDVLPLHVFWAVWAGYFGATGLFDLATGANMVLMGVELDEMFHLPPLASSPRDFWSRRWNMAFRDMCHRLIFEPLGGRRHLVRSVLVVFAFSALVHEYLVVAALGTTAGFMTVFFMSHGVATLVHGVWAKRRTRPMPRWAAVPLHMAWFTLTAWFFFEPVLIVFPIDKVRLW
jgi:hypothetical protein